MYAVKNITESWEIIAWLKILNCQTMLTYSQAHEFATRRNMNFLTESGKLCSKFFNAMLGNISENLNTY